MAAAATIERQPTAEVYGRSLSTIHRLGAFMIERALDEVATSPEAAQARVEFYTSVEEGFGTDLELGGGLEVRDFDTRPIINGKVMAKDLKTAVSEMTAAGLSCAMETAKTDDRFFPQLIRSKWDHHNALLVDQMARGEAGYNTRIVISPFPEEAAAESGNDYWRNIGYVPHLKRGFVQLYHTTGEEVITGSLSFDGCSKKQLQEVFMQLGIDIPADEVTDNWLKYAITGNLSVESAKAMAVSLANKAGGHQKKTTNTVDVTREYQPIMERAFNESYIHICESLARGRQTPGARRLIFQLADKAHSFNEHYAKALYSMRANEHNFTDNDSIVLHELLVYSTIEMMRALHMQKMDATGNVQLFAGQLQSIDARAFQNMLGNFGADGARHNRTYSACGLAITPGEMEKLNENPQYAYGGAESGEDRYGPRRFQCTIGHWNTRPYNKLIEKCQHKGCKGKVSC